MYRSFFTYGIWIALLFLYSGCDTGLRRDDQVVAEAGAKKLYLSEVAAVIPNDTGHEDSIVLADDYIRKWIRQELLLQKAEENLANSLKNVDKELEEYRNSLIIFRYKKELMAQRMDTAVSDAEILEIYAENPENFKLNNSIVKAVFIKIAGDFADPEFLKEMSGDSSEQGINELRDYCVKYAKGFDIYTDRWIDLNLMLNNIPVTMDNPEKFLRENQLVEYADSSYYYLVNIHEYKLKNEQAPIEYVKDNIKSLILNRRKIDFLKELENNIYREGVNRNTFKIYNIETNE